MQHLDVISVTLLVIAGYVAVWALVRLMMKRRDHMIEQFREEVEREKKAKESERKQKAFEDLARRSA